MICVCCLLGVLAIKTRCTRLSPPAHILIGIIEMQSHLSTSRGTGNFCYLLSRPTGSRDLVATTLCLLSSYICAQVFSTLSLFAYCIFIDMHVGTLSHITQSPCVNCLYVCSQALATFFFVCFFFIDTRAYTLTHFAFRHTGTFGYTRSRWHCLGHLDL